MKNLILIALTFVLLPGLLLAAEMGASAGHDLDQLWSQAQSEFDLDVEDAVLLLESHQHSFDADGIRQTRVHRVVWIGTAVGIRNYADLRVPWNMDTSTLEVEILRTWREGRWWPDAKEISETAVVHTLPYAMDRADDYTTMRETMLLHDGVELGCIMETAYTITEKNVPAAGGVFVLPQQDPAVLTELRVIAPEGRVVSFRELNGVGAPESRNPTAEMDLLWQQRLTPALGRPVANHPETYEPTVVWSTWNSWNELAETWRGSYDEKIQLSDLQIEKFQKTLNAAMGPRQRVAAVGNYLNEMVRGIHYDHGFWQWNPRTSSRTLETAYGHDLDRAILLSALLAEAGVPGEPMFLGRGQTMVAADVPRLEGLERILLGIPSVDWVILDPADGHLLAWDEMYGCPHWFMDGGEPEVMDQVENGLAVAVNLAKGEDDTWTGSGYFRGTSQFSEAGALQSGNDLKEGFLAGLSESVLTDLKLSGATPMKMEMGVAEINLQFADFTPGSDDHDRKTLAVGHPRGGILSRLPAGVHLYDETRQSPVDGLEGWEQSVILRFEIGESTLVHKPESFVLTNASGRFELQVKEEDGWLILIRTLQLGGPTFGAEDWPHLRALLLEEADPRHGLVLWK